MKILSIVCAVSVVTACAQQSIGLKEELRRASITEGLALVSVGGSHIELIPFDADQRTLVADPSRRIPLLIGDMGTTAVYSYRSSFLQPWEFFVLPLAGGSSGQLSAEGIHAQSSFIPVALNEASGRIAFWSSQPGQSPPSLRWTSLDFARGGLIGATDGNCSWSPDGSQLAYEKNGVIYRYEVGNATSKVLASGFDPTWSPNGMWISMRSPAGTASLVKADGRAVNWPLGAHRPSSRMHWAPNGLFVSFVEEIGAASSENGQARLVVSRVADGSTIEVKVFGPPGGAMRFDWILGYHDFCRSCAIE